jgi:hypothetical protein
MFDKPNIYIYIYRMQFQLYHHNTGFNYYIYNPKDYSNVQGRLGELNLSTIELPI